MLRTLPWPFSGGTFPPELGAVVQLTVLNGDRPARLVQHGHEGDWAVGDGDDPNATGAAIATHIWHAIERNSSITELADLRPGWLAIRQGPGEPWLRKPFDGDV